jgi:diguanylate cyclase (GGDEF)-like protein
VAQVLIFNSNSEEREFLRQIAGENEPVYVTGDAKNALSLLQSRPISLAIVEVNLAELPALRSALLNTPCLILTGRREDVLKESVVRWPRDRFIDYIVISPLPSDATRGQRILAIAREYAQLKARVEALTNSKISADSKLKQISAEVKALGDSLSTGLAKAQEKRSALEMRYLRFQNVKKKFEDTLRKLHAANDFSNLLDIVRDIKDLVHASGVSLYISDENESLGRYLKPLVWDDIVPTHAEFAGYFTTWMAQDFAAHVARTGQVLNLTDAENDVRFSKRYRVHLRTPLRSLLASPLISEGAVIGLIEVYNKAEGDRIVASGFDEDDRQSLSELSEHIALAITKLNLIQYDALTGLLRPDPFFLKVTQKIEIQSKRRQETGFYAMVMGDVDWFKNYNDRNGQEAGNRLLRELAVVLKASIREDDFLCRYGGEEFLFFLAGVKTIEEATLLTERIRKNVEGHLFEFEEFQPRHKLTMSFGVTLLPRDMRDDRGFVTKDMLKNIAHEADLAMGEAKGKRFAAFKDIFPPVSKNRVCAYVRDKSTVMSNTTLLREAAEKSFVEKRHDRRYDASTLCLYRENGSHRVTNTIDLSLGGAKISSKIEFPKAKALELFIVLGSKANPFKGDVVYSQRASPGSSYFYTGVKFRDISQDDRIALQNYFVSLGKRDIPAA